MLLDARQFRLQPIHLFTGQLAEILVGLLQHQARVFQVAPQLFPLAVRGDDLLQFPVRLGGLAVFLRIADDGRIGHVARQFLEPRFDLIQLACVFHVRRMTQAMTRWPALGLLQRHRALQCVDGHRDLVDRTGGCVVMRCSHRPGAVSAASKPPRRLAAKRISS